MTVLPDGRVVLTVLNSERPRLVAVERGKNPVAMVTTTEETSTPVTLACLSQSKVVLAGD